MTKVDIHSSRPLKAVTLVEGKKVEDALELLPRLFSVCATSQAGAAVRACQNALGHQPGEAVEAARDILMALETAREHLLRIALDWPGVLGEAATPAWAAPLTRMLSETKSALFGDSDGFSLNPKLNVNESALYSQIEQLHSILESEVFAEPVDDWVETKDLATWRNWSAHSQTPAARLVKMVIDAQWSRAGSIASRFLPDLKPIDLQDRMSSHDVDDFVARPDWCGRCFETTSLARQSYHPLIRALIEELGSGIETRLAAKLVELASIKARLDELLQKLSNDNAEKRTDSIGEGIGQVEAARGRLVHWVRLSGETVNSYRILAPTEWNFHPEGAAVQSLQALPAEDEQDLRNMAKLLIESIDPCVGYEMTVH